MNKTKFNYECDRLLISNAIDTAYELAIKRQHPCRFRRWKAVNDMVIYTIKSRVMAEIHIPFDATEGSEVTLPRVNGTPQVTLSLRFVMSKKYRNDEVQAWWNTVQTSVFTVGNQELRFDVSQMVYNETFVGIRSRLRHGLRSFSVNCLNRWAKIFVWSKLAKPSDLSFLA